MKQTRKKSFLSSKKAITAGALTLSAAGAFFVGTHLNMPQAHAASSNGEVTGSAEDKDLPVTISGFTLGARRTDEYFATDANEPAGIFHQSFVAGSKKYQAYCVNAELYTPQAGMSLSEKQRANNLLYHVILNGYPLKSASQMGIDSKIHAYMVTQYAVWIASGSLNPNSLHWTSSYGKEKVMALLKKAAQDTRKQGMPSMTLVQQGQPVVTHNYVTTQTSSSDTSSASGIANSSSNTSVSDASLIPGASSANSNSTSTSSNGADVNTVAGDNTSSSIPGGNVVTGNANPGATAKQQDLGTTTTKYKIKVSGGWSVDNVKVSKIQGDYYQDGKKLTVGSEVDPDKPITNVKQNSAGNGETGIEFTGWVPGYSEVATYKTHSAGKTAYGYQNAVVSSNVNPKGVPISASNTGKTNTPSNLKIHINKSDSTTNQPLANIKFDLIDKNTMQVVQSGTTNADGDLDFTVDKPGNFYVRENDTDNEHVVNHMLHEVDVTQDDIDSQSEPELDITNDRITDAPYIKSSATEVGTGSRYVDAKTTNLQDELEIDNLDGQHSYRVVDTLMDMSTGKPATLDGKPVTATQTITSNADRGQHDGQKITMNYNGVKFQGQQGHRYAFQAQVFSSDGTNDPSTDNKLLATEFSLGDSNQTIQVRKPVITSQVRNAVGENSTSGTQFANPYEHSHWIDKITTNYLVPLHSYTIHAKMMDKQADGSVKPLIVHGKEVTATKTFTADNDQMDQDVDFGEVDTTQLKGHDLVVYSNITPSEDENTELANHNDANDKAETIHITNPKLHTKALIDDDKVSNPNSASRLKDQVWFSDVSDDTPMTVSAIATNKDNTATVIKTHEDPNDKTKDTYDYLMGKVEFTPDSNEGYVEVPLQKVATPSKRTVDVSQASVRQKMNTLTAIAPDSASIDPTEAAETANKNTYSSTLAGQLGYKPADDQSVYDIPTESLAGKDVVLFEDAYLQGDDNPIVSEHDVNNTDQTVHITNPKIKSTLNIDGKKLSNPQSSSTITDKVQYTDVAPGHLLQLNSMLLNHADGKAITITDSKGNKFHLMGKTNFIPTKANGTTLVPIQEVDANGDSVVDNNGNPSILAALKTRDVKVENVKDDRTYQKFAQAVQSISTDGNSTANLEQLNKLQSVMTGLSGMVYDSSVGIPQSLVNRLNQMITSINGGNTNLTDLAESIIDLQKEYKADVDGGSLVTNSQYETAVAQAKQATSSDDYNTDVPADKVVQKVTNKILGDSVDKDGKTNNTDDYLLDPAQAANRIAANNITPNNPRITDDPTDTSTPNFKIDTRKLRGITMTAYEDLTQPTDNNAQVITSDGGTKNTDQSVRVTNPRIHTMFMVNDKKTEYTSTKLAYVVDKVMFEDFAPGQKAVLTSVAMDKGTGEAAKLNGHFIVGRTTFTPQATSGTVKVPMNTQEEEPEIRYMTKQLDANGMPLFKADTTQQAHSTATDSQLLNMDGSTMSDGQDTGYESQADNSNGTDNVNDHTDTQQMPFDLTSLYNERDDNNNPTPVQWTAFETAEWGDNDNTNHDVFTEEKNLNDTDQTITIKIPTNGDTPTPVTPTGAGTNNNNNNNNSQTQTNGNNTLTNGGNTVTVNVPSSVPGTTTTTTVPTTTVPATVTPTTYTTPIVTGQQTQAQTQPVTIVNKPSFAQTGGGSKLSNNKIYNWLFGWLK